MIWWWDMKISCLWNYWIGYTLIFTRRTNEKSGHNANSVPCWRTHRDNFRSDTRNPIIFNCNKFAILWHPAYRHGNRQYIGIERIHTCIHHVEKSFSVWNHMCGFQIKISIGISILGGYQKKHWKWQNRAAPIISNKDKKRTPLWFLRQIQHHEMCHSLNWWLQIEIR